MRHEKSVGSVYVRGPGRARREDRLTIRELSSLRRPTEQLIERLNCRGHATGAWASAAADCLSRRRARRRRASRLTSRNLGEPVNNRPSTLLLGSTSCVPADRAMLCDMRPTIVEPCAGIVPRDRSRNKVGGTCAPRAQTSLGALSGDGRIYWTLRRQGCSGVGCRTSDDRVAVLVIARRDDRASPPGSCQLADR